MRVARRSVLSSGFALLIVSLGASCGATSPSAPATPPSDAGNAAPGADAGVMGSEVSFRRDVVPLFDASCAFAGCHSADSYTDLLLGPSSSVPPEQTYQVLLSRSSIFYSGSLRLVVPDQPEQSFLYRKLTGDFTGLACDANGGCGPRMPLQRTPPQPPPSAASIASVSAWIAMGAPDN